MEKKHSLDIVVPIHNEADNLLDVIERIECDVLPSFTSVTLIYVDDGSKDNTREIISNLEPRAALNILYVKFSINFRKDLAVKCGIDHSKADYCAVMDGDLQQPPEKIVEAYNKAIEEGLELVHIMKSQYKTKFYRRIGSGLFSTLINKFAGFDIHLTDFKLMGKKIAKEMQLRSENKLFFAGVVERLGFREGEIQYDVEDRKHGESYFSLKNLIRLSVKSITCISVKPLRFASFIGFFLAMGSLIFTLWIVLEKLILGQDIPGFTTMAGGFFFIGGLQLLVLGIIGEYIGQIYLEVKNTKQYIVEEEISIEAANH